MSKVIYHDGDMYQPQHMDRSLYIAFYNAWFGHKTFVQYTGEFDKDVMMETLSKYWFYDNTTKILAVNKNDVMLYNVDSDKNLKEIPLDDIVAKCVKQNRDNPFMAGWMNLYAACNGDNTDQTFVEDSIYKYLRRDMDEEDLIDEDDDY